MNRRELYQTLTLQATESPQNLDYAVKVLTEEGDILDVVTVEVEAQSSTIWLKVVLEEEEE